MLDLRQKRERGGGERERRWGVLGVLGVFGGVRGWVVQEAAQVWVQVGVWGRDPDAGEGPEECRVAPWPGRSASFVWSVALLVYARTCACWCADCATDRTWRLLPWVRAVSVHEIMEAQECAQPAPWNIFEASIARV